MGGDPIAMILFILLPGQQGHPHGHFFHAEQQWLHIEKEEYHRDGIPLPQIYPVICLESRDKIAPLPSSCLATPSTVEIIFTAELQIFAPGFEQLWTDLSRVPRNLPRRFDRILLNNL